MTEVFANRFTIYDVFRLYTDLVLSTSLALEFYIVRCQHAFVFGGDE